jgi:hypothetical protein
MSARKIQKGKGTAQIKTRKMRERKTDSRQADRHSDIHRDHNKEQRREQQEHTWQ